MNFLFMLRCFFVFHLVTYLLIFECFVNQFPVLKNPSYFYKGIILCFVLWIITFLLNNISIGEEIIKILLKPFILIVNGVVFITVLVLLITDFFRRFKKKKETEKAYEFKKEKKGINKIKEFFFKKKLMKYDFVANKIPKLYLVKYIVATIHIKYFL